MHADDNVCALSLSLMKRSQNIKRNLIELINFLLIIIKKQNENIITKINNENN